LKKNARFNPEDCLDPSKHQEKNYLGARSTMAAVQILPSSDFQEQQTRTVPRVSGTAEAISNGNAVFVQSLRARQMPISQTTTD